VGGLSAARPLDASGRWADALRAGGRAREDAVFRLRAHLTAAAQFEFGRRGITGDGPQRQEAALLVRDAAETALAAVLADLDRFRGESAFATWTAKYAIHEAAAAARAKGSASRAPGDGWAEGAHGGEGIASQIDPASSGRAYRPDETRGS
jgi:hypothetical protein